MPRRDAAGLAHKFTRIIFCVALLCVYIATQRGNVGPGAVHSPADTSASNARVPAAAAGGRRLQGFGRHSRVAWKSTRDEDAIIGRSNDTTAPRIAWGRPLKPGWYPFAAYLSIDGYVCTGSLVAPRVVMTAAHCVFTRRGRSDEGEWADVTSGKVLLGGVDINQMASYSIASAYIPNGYEGGESYYFGDIALVELTEPATGIKPIALAVPKANLAKVTNVMAIGWGQTEDQDLPDVAKYAKITLYNNSRCNDLSLDIFKAGVPEDKLCFGLDQFSLCQGDSGGPVIARNRKGSVLIGITSYGKDAVCGEQNSLSMGTSVSYWRQFVEQLLSFYNLRGSSAPTKANNLAPGQCYQGSSIATAKMLAWRCVEKCRASSRCYAWSHNSETNLCTMLSFAYQYIENDNCTSGYFRL